MFMEYQERCEEYFMKFEVTRAKEERAYEEQLFQPLLSFQTPCSMMSHHPPVNPVPHFPMPWHYPQSPTGSDDAS